MSTIYKGAEFLLDFSGNGFCKVLLMDKLNTLAVEIISKSADMRELQDLFDDMLECVK